MANKLYPVNYGNSGMMDNCIWVHDCSRGDGSKEIVLCKMANEVPFGETPKTSDTGTIVSFAKMHSPEELEAVIEALRAVCDDWKE